MDKKKILLIDDEASLTGVLKQIIEEEGAYEVREENTSSNALATAQAFGPDLIFCDIKMPDVSGSEVAAQIREDAALAEVPIVFFTGALTAAEEEASGGEIGGQFMMAKPVDPEKLLSCIKTHLGE